MTTEQIKSTMSAREFLDWEHEYQREPWGEYRADLRAGIIAMTVYNMQRGKGRSLSASDFMPDFEPKKPQGVAEMQARLLLATGAKLNGEHRKT